MLKTKRIYTIVRLSQYHGDEIVLPLFVVYIV